MKIVSYYTNEKYKKAAGELEKSLNTFGLPYEIESVTDRGSHLKNCQFKASFILWKLETHPEEDILVWMDADTRVRKNPLVFRYPKNDVMLYSMGEGSFWSTVGVFRNTKVAKEIVQAWVKGHTLYPEQSDGNIPLDKRIGRLPPIYVWFAPVFKPIFGQLEPVIEHLCISRVS